ncbi:capsular polysaccharide synthesis protein [Campylobacter sp. MIT 99-7217]|uniref:capsular polysaccharide synthesis protein n=1 Tax=Campylobacter sp. MIT 99-7217 TaxID=535091 RepID=UPI0021AF3857|nr:capsular polysaccharide synthesis protein [Campylobacter sp. MIT 99-7217]
MRNKIEHPKAANFLKQNYVLPFLEGAIPNFPFKAKKHFEDEKIIWQLWYQGEQNAPALIQKCLSSVKKHMGKEYKIIVLDEQSIKDYIDFPDFVYEKLRQKSFGEKSVTFFSDLLRMSLLSVYGGIWLDASIFLSDKIPQKLCQKDFFVYQRSKLKPQDHKEWTAFDYRYFIWEKDFRARFFSAFIIAKKDYPLITALKDILMNFWQKENELPHYFTLHFIFDLLLENENYQALNCELTNDTDIHLVQFHAKKGDLREKWQDIKSKSFLHKLHTTIQGVDPIFGD